MVDHKTRTRSAKPAPCLAVLGTGSDVGKSVLATGLCRIFSNRGLRVAPFKAQNMSNNSGVTPEGLEMGRAQIVQAEAARTPPHVDMNPVLLKPTSEVGSQVIVCGKVIGNRRASQYYKDKEKLFATACRCLDRLRRDYDLVIIEGAGSCAEVNLLEHDFVNFKTAAHARAPVVLAGDIHRGGIFAQLVGTLVCLPPSYRRQVTGFIINRFRGDPGLFSSGTAWIEEKTSLPVFGVVPWFTDIFIDQEDAVVIETPRPSDLKDVSRPAIAIIRLPHIANFTDFAVLESVSGLGVYYLDKARNLEPFAAVILPGSKNTRSDLDWLHLSGWAKRLTEYHRLGGRILGICGGYQMLGTTIDDPEGLEGRPGVSQGLAMLPVQTALSAPKTTTLTVFRWQQDRGLGYEIHMGRTRLSGGRPWLEVISRNGRPASGRDGCLSQDGRVMGTYIHGLFDEPAIVSRWLSSIGLGQMKVSGAGGLAGRNSQYELLAKHLEQHLDIKSLTTRTGICLT